MLGAGIVLVMCLASLAVVVAGRAEKARKREGPMTREETGKLVEAFGRSLGPGASYPQSGGIMLPDGVTIWFEYTEQSAFICSVLVVDLGDFEDSTSNDAILQGLHDEERSGTPTGGAQLEYVSETRRLFLRRTYLQRVDEKTFIADMRRLADAGWEWGEEVFGRVMDRINVGKQAVSR